MRKILIAGGSGLVGTILRKHFNRLGFSVYILSRKEKSEEHFLYWNPTQRKIDPKCQDLPFFAVINCCGVGIADRRWTKKRKELLRSSRIQPTLYLWELIENHDIHTQKFLNLSATGYYGSSLDPVNELDQVKAEDFVGQLVRDWEYHFFEHSLPNVDATVLRLGVVLSKKGGFLSPFNQAMRLCLAPYFGSGKDFISWIHEQDLARSIHHILENDAPQKIYNLTSPYPTMTKNLSKRLKIINPSLTIVIGIPTFIVKTIFGEMSEIILTNVQALPYHLLEEGFQFHYSTIEESLAEIYR